MTRHRRIRQLTTDQSWCLLGTVPLGRIAFTANAMPEIRPVIHIVENDDLIIRSRMVAAIHDTGGQVVSYEADTLNADARLGWSVIVLGRAHLVQDPAEVERYHQILTAWVDPSIDYVIRVRPENITGYEIVADTIT